MHILLLHEIQIINSKNGNISITIKGGQLV